MPHPISNNPRFSAVNIIYSSKVEPLKRERTKPGIELQFYNDLRDNNAAYFLFHPELKRKEAFEKTGRIEHLFDSKMLSDPIVGEMTNVFANKPTQPEFLAALRQKYGNVKPEFLPLMIRADLAQFFDKLRATSHVSSTNEFNNFDKAGRFETMRRALHEAEEFTVRHSKAGPHSVYLGHYLSHPPTDGNYIRVDEASMVTVRPTRKRKKKEDS